MKNQKRKICFVITSFIHYSRNLLILEELEKRDNVDLHIIVGSKAIITSQTSKSVQIINNLKLNGFRNIHEIYFNVDGDTEVSKSKTVGLGIIEFSSIFNEIKPDIVLIRGDRFEVLSAAIAAVYMNIVVAHIEGGDVSGTIDESIRHTITKLAHIHFVTNDDSEKRVLRMGEKKDYIFNFGSPDIEIIDNLLSKDKIPNLKKTGSGADIDTNNDFIMVMYHPVTTEVSDLSKNTNILLETVNKLNLNTLWFWPNFDRGGDIIARELRIFKDSLNSHKIRFLRYIPPEEFMYLLNKTKCLIGNSSAGIKECSYMGVPVVNMGSRQNKRLSSENVVDVSNDKNELQKAIKDQLNIGRYNRSYIYKKDNTSKRIADALANIDLYLQKSFED